MTNNKNITQVLHKPLYLSMVVLGHFFNRPLPEKGSSHRLESLSVCLSLITFPSPNIE